MLRYVIRRILYMVPTVFGIIIITFALFNMAGGDPAMKKLGKQATAKALEEYDTQRGYNKPLLWGFWGKTRAYQSDFAINATPWTAVEGVVYTNNPGRILLPSGRSYQVPLSFNLRTNESYRWKILCRLARPGQEVSRTGAGTSVKENQGAENRDTESEITYSRLNTGVQEVADTEKPSGRRKQTAEFVVATGSNIIQTVSLDCADDSWRRIRVEFRTGADTADLKFGLAVNSGMLEVKALRLERRAKHIFFDSQLMFFLGQIAHFDFGRSAETNQKVSTMILDGILPSLLLAVPIFFIGIIVEVSLALVCAFFRNTLIDRFFVVISVIFMSLPYLVWIIGGQYILGYRFRLFPVWGFESLRYLVLPAVIGVVSGIGGGLRFYRTIMLDEMYKDYVRTAFAKGVGKYGVLFKHVLKNAMIPILTSAVMTIPFLYTGNLLLETFFGIPGLGNLAVNGILNSDVDVVRAVVLVGAIIYVIANLMTDICYTLVDPRVKLR